jgi:hypothetical protein
MHMSACPAPILSIAGRAAATLDLRMGAVASNARCYDYVHHVVRQATQTSPIVDGEASFHFGFDCRRSAHC